MSDEGISRWRLIQSLFAAQIPRFTGVAVVASSGVPKAPSGRRVASPTSNGITLDPAPLERIWYQLLIEYFPDHPELPLYKVLWSPRQQKRVLASCDMLGKRVRVARELARPEYESFLPALLYHEMCHAVIGRDVERRNGARLWHGPQFKALEARHPGSALLQKWITEGGWATAVRRDRAFAAARRRKQ
jgi:hypothetical protein